MIPDDSEGAWRSWSQSSREERVQWFRPDARVEAQCSQKKVRIIALGKIQSILDLKFLSPNVQPPVNS